jgi:subtilisin family serine protease
VRYNARILDSATSVLLPHQPPIKPTVYVADRLLVRTNIHADVRPLLIEAANRNGVRLTQSAAEQARGQRVHALAAASAPSQHDTVRLEPAGPKPVSTDAWAVLQTFRSLAGLGHAEVGSVSLDHLMTASRHIEGSPVDPSGWSNTAAGRPMASYGTPGWGGRMPVNWLGQAPARRPDGQLRRRPVVAVLDTGCGRHPWLPPEIVTRNVSFQGVPIGLQDPGDDPEVSGMLVDPLEGVLDPDAGHGTFIAGLIRQLCPDADVLAIRVMPSDGAVPEHVLLDALHLLVARQRAAQQAGDPSGVIDVLSLSLGYYHEQPQDRMFDLPLWQPLDALSRMGVAIVAAAGNDATTRPFYPAAFAPHSGGEVSATSAGQVPVVSVGALNPNGTIALFSNGGDWVTTHRPGADLVSTFPTTFNGGAQPAYRRRSADGVHESLDQDDFSCGFGTWSGTSFAAPTLAGQLAQAMVDDRCGDIGPVDASAMLRRTWSAVSLCAGIHQPPAAQP